MNKKIMIIAGEASGDLHGASLIKELKKLDSEFDICGIGGDKMISAGMKAQYHINQMAFLGFVEVLKHLPFIRSVREALIKKVSDESIKTVVLIDYPGFNLNFAKLLKQIGVKVIYYISPQIWAWGKGRINKIKELVTKMIVVFPFEETMYKEYGVDAEYVGHPLVEHLEDYKFLSRSEFFKKFDLDINKEILLLLPGSRKDEIKKIFPPVIEAAEKLAEDFNMQIVIACAENIDSRLIINSTGRKDLKIIKGYTYDLLMHSYFGIIKSGTSTLETGYMRLPFIVVYSTNSLTYFLGKLVVKIKNIAMANIILGKTVVKELIQQDVNAENIYKCAAEVISDKAKYESVENELSAIKDKLGKPGSSARAAKIIFDAVNEA